MTTSAPVTFNAIDKLLKEGQPVYVRNATANPMFGLAINYPSQEGDRVFVVPRTTIPFEITGEVPHESLRNSNSFRRMINGGQLLVVPEAAAARELSDPSVRSAWKAAWAEANNTAVARKDEFQKERDARAEERAGANDVASAVNSVLAAVDPKLAGSLNRLNSSHVPERQDMDGGRNVRLLSLEKRMAAGSLKVNEAIRELTSLLGELTASDLKDIINSRVWPPAVQNWATERLSFRQAAPEPSIGSTPDAQDHG